MSVELEIAGFLGITFTTINGSEVTQKEEKIILDGLQKGDYVISINKKTVSDLDNFEKPIYLFDIDNTEGVEYDWDEV